MGSQSGISPRGLLENDNNERVDNVRERGDRGAEEVSTEIGNQSSEKRSIEQASLCSRPAARSTGVHDVHKVNPVDRPVDRGRERSTGPVDRLTRP